MPPTHYHVLGIAQSATPDDVRRAYKLKARETHPDKLNLSGDEKEKREAESRFHRVHEAFEVLKDEGKRKAYDDSLRSKAHARASYIRPMTANMDEAQRRRNADRQAWAQTTSERHSAQARERARADQAKAAQLRTTAAKVAAAEAAKKRRADEAHAAQVAKMFTEMLRETRDLLFPMDPDWAKRRHEALRSKEKQAALDKDREKWKRRHSTAR